MKHSFKYQGGEIILINYPFTNLESKKVRPALVIRAQKDDDLLIAPISTTVQRARNDYLIQEQDYAGPALPVLSCLRFEKLFTLNSELVLKSVTKLKKQTLKSIQQKIATFITQA